METKDKQLDNPLISVVVPCFNCSSTIKETVRSVMNQTYQNYEIILVCGNDKNPKTKPAILEATKEIPSEKKQIVFLETNLGPGNNRNVGISLAHGKYIALLDSDDVFLPRHLETAFKNIQEYHCDMVCGFLFGDGERQSSKDQRPRKISFQMEAFKNRIHVSTILAKNENWFRFDARIMLYAEDIFLWLKLLSDGHSIYRFPVQLTCSGESPNQITRKNQLEMYKARKKMYKFLLEDKKIKLPFFSLISTYEWVKNIRRKFRRNKPI